MSDGSYNLTLALPHSAKSVATETRPNSVIRLLPPASLKFTSIVCSPDRLIDVESFHVFGRRPQCSVTLPGGAKVQHYNASLPERSGFERREKVALDRFADYETR